MIICCCDNDWLTLCMLGNFSCLYCRLLTFSKIFFSFNTIRVSNSLDLDQDRHVGPDLGPNCLQRSSVDNKISHLQTKSYCKYAMIFPRFSNQNLVTPRFI